MSTKLLGSTMLSWVKPRVPWLAQRTRESNETVKIFSAPANLHPKTCGNNQAKEPFSKGLKFDCVIVLNQVKSRASQTSD